MRCFIAFTYVGDVVVVVVVSPFLFLCRSLVLVVILLRRCRNSSPCLDTSRKSDEELGKMLVLKLDGSCSTDEQKPKDKENSKRIAGDQVTVRVFLYTHYHTSTFPKKTTDEWEQSLKLIDLNIFIKSRANWLSRAKTTFGKERLNENYINCTSMLELMDHKLWHSPYSCTLFYSRSTTHLQPRRKQKRN